jgi:hypothetical protein
VANGLGDLVQSIVWIMQDRTDCHYLKPLLGHQTKIARCYTFAAWREKSFYRRPTEAKFHWEMG